MNRREAKEILSLYRPGTADVNDPAFTEALPVCENDAALKIWFKAHCESYHALRARFKQIPVPEGLKEQIVAERKIQTGTSRRPTLFIYAAIAAVLLLTVIFAPRWHRLGEDASLPAFRNWTVSTGLRLYRMDLETHDLTQIRNFLEAHKAESDYVVPDALQKNAQATGCALLAWHGQRVSMICFHSGKPLGPGETSDLFLFVTDSATVAETPTGKIPSMAHVSRASTACWKKDGKVYLLVAAGDESFIRRFL